ncbi:MAG: protein kinase, partial [Roseiflexaceae bacterium]|nr:protein kinase [Roseiflexaceae bacterium]
MTEPAGNLPLVPNYTLERLIGESSAGRVYQARHTPSGQPVAMRLLPATVLANPAIAERLTNELRAAVGLRHTNIIETYTTGQADERPFIIMELAQGGSLRNMLRARAQAGPLPLDLCIELGRQATAALIYAHGRDQIHGAIKPENLLFGRTFAINEPPQLKLSDFGISWLPDALAEGATVVTSPSAPYLSPEQCQGLPLIAQSDIYTLGIVLYELVAGLPPFPVETLTDAVQQHVFAAPPPLAGARAGVPQSLEALIMRCLAKQPEDRIASAADLATALELVRADLPAPVVQPLPAPDAPTIAGRGDSPVVVPQQATVIEQVPVVLPVPPIAQEPTTVPEPRILQADATVIAPVPAAEELPISPDVTLVPTPLSPEPTAGVTPNDATVVSPTPVFVAPIDATLAPIPVPSEPALNVQPGDAAALSSEPPAEQPRGSADETVIGPVPVVVPPVPVAKAAAPVIAVPIAPIELARAPAIADEPSIADFTETVPPVASNQPRLTPPVIG